MIKNSLNREIPETIPGIKKVIPFNGVHTVFPEGKKNSANLKRYKKEHNKIVKNIEELLEKVEIKDGMTISFHHHFRNGDKVLNYVLDAIAKKGIKDLTITSSSLTTAHDHILPYLENGTITKIITSGLRSKLGQYASFGKLKYPVIFHSHGGRARRIEQGLVSIDIAFIASPGCDFMGNINGIDSETPCGSLGYTIIDAQYANKVVAITNEIKEKPLSYYSIPHYLVDYILKIDEIGDPAKIGTGATRITKNPIDLLIAKNAAKLIYHSPYFKNNFSFQTGSGGASLAVAKFLQEYMDKKNITGSFAIGGITGYLVDLHKQGYFEKLFDVQSFDKKAALSLKENPDHIEIDASFYANPFNASALVNYLDIVILSALEIDTNFNVNVLTGSNGVIRGASGGHSDTSYGAKLTIVVAPSFRSRIPTVVDKVLTVVTPGESIDVLVTERGIAVNPRRKDIIDWIKNTDLNIIDIHDLKEKIYSITGKPEDVKFKDNIIGVVEYRDGSIIDVIREVEH